ELAINQIGCGAQAKHALATRIRKHTRNAFGASLPPHWFRDAAATSIAALFQHGADLRDPQRIRAGSKLTTLAREQHGPMDGEVVRPIWSPASLTVAAPCSTARRQHRELPEGGLGPRREGTQFGACCCKAATSFQR